MRSYQPLTDLTDGRGEPLKILVADDDDFSRALLVQVLERLKHEVTAVPDGLAAWEAARRGR
jgi:CheY-like chemotaxis protein